MALHRRVAKVGGSLGILIPRDLAEVMGVEEGTPVRLSLVGRQMVVEPEDDSLPEASFQRSFATVLRRYGPAFRALADFDRGKAVRPRLARGSRRKAGPRPR
jgi:antitoxin component of MazEF toxin-antitoxin module